MASSHIPHSLKSSATAGTKGPFPARGHDHARCVTSALDEAQNLCASKGARLTALRQKVLELVWESHKPVGAYEVLAALKVDRPGAKPPTVYRALEFLLDHGLIHRIERLNAYVGCACPGEKHSGQFLICTECGCAAELQDASIIKALTQGAESAGFELERPLVEVEGKCSACREGRGQP